MKMKILLMTIMLSIIITICLDIYTSFNEKEGEQTQKHENIVIPFNTSDNTTKKFTAPLSDEDFIVKNDSTFIELGGKYTDMKTDEEIVSIHDADEKQAYKVVTFENFIIATVPVNEGAIMYINLTTSVLKTHRGISIGDTMSDVFNEYGLVDTILPESYKYHYNGKILTFYIDEYDKVTRIQLELV